MIETPKSRNVFQRRHSRSVRLSAFGNQYIGKRSVRFAIFLVCPYTAVAIRKKKFLRTITLPHWHFATSLAAYVDLSSSKAYIAAGLNTGKIFLVNYHTEQTADMSDVDVAMEKGNVKALVFCPSQSTLVLTCESNLLCWNF